VQKLAHVSKLPAEIGTLWEHWQNGMGTFAHFAKICNLFEIACKNWHILEHWFCVRKFASFAKVPAEIGTLCKHYQICMQEEY
jgi:predicted NAD-dependent protein-ADP-ribosyltransferase YbiA (DUF1768 family)